MANEDAAKIAGSLFEKISGSNEAIKMENNGMMMQMMGSFTLLRLTGMLSMMGVELSKNELITLNKRLNAIKK